MRLALVLASAGAASASGTTEHEVVSFGNVILELERVEKDLLEEKHGWLINIAETKGWCAKSIEENERNIVTQTENLEEANNLEAEAAARLEQIALDTGEANFKKTTAEHNLEALKSWYAAATIEYDSKKADLDDTIQACASATAKISGLNASYGAKPASAAALASKSFLQTIRPKIAKQYRTDFDILLNQQPLQEQEVVHTNAGTAKVKKILTDLSAAASKELDELTVAWEATGHGNDLESHTLTLEIETLVDRLSKLAVAQGEHEAKKSTAFTAGENASKLLTDEKNSKQNNERYCGRSADTFAGNMNAINSDIAGIREAISVLAKKPNAFAFLQLASSSLEPKRRFIEMLSTKAKMLHSRLLTGVVQSVQRNEDCNGEGPLACVIDKIKVMVTKLQDEQENAEGILIECDAMKVKANGTLDDATTAQELAVTGKEAAEAELVQLIQNKQSAMTVLAETEEALQTGNEQRANENKSSLAGMAEADLQAKLLGEALDVLYKTSSGVTETGFVQATSSIKLPEEIAARASHGGLKGAIGIIEGVKAGQEELSIKLQTEEETAADLWHDAKHQWELLIDATEHSITNLTENIGQKEDDIWDLGETKRIAIEKYDAAFHHLHKVVIPKCDAMHAKRKADRGAELQSLKDGLQILQAAHDDINSSP